MFSLNVSEYLQLVLWKIVEDEMVFEAVDNQIGVMQSFLLEDYVDVLSDSFLYIL